MPKGYSAPLPATGSCVKAYTCDAALSSPTTYSYFAPGTRPDRTAVWKKPASR